MFVIIGVNYNSASLSDREKFSFTDSEKIEFMRLAQAEAALQMMVLSTCNRCELCCWGEDAADISERLFCGRFGIEAEQLSVRLRDEEAMAYLFRVSSGLESMVLGEDQILAQVREAWELSRAVGCSGKELNRIVLDALTCAKKIKTELKISEVPLSVSYIGIKLLEEKRGLKGRKILVIGSGKTAALSIRYLREYENVKIIACSRNYVHSEHLREEFPEIDILPFADRYKAMAYCDIVVSATSAPHYVVKAEKIPAEREIVFLDLAAPRDIDPAAAEQEKREIIDLDVLQKISEENMELRLELSERSRGMVVEAVDETVKWLSAVGVDHTLRSLHELCGEITSDSLAYLERKMELSGHDRKLLQKVLSASLLRLIREPIRELKNSDLQEQQEYSRILARLFGFDQEGLL